MTYSRWLWRTGTLAAVVAGAGVTVLLRTGAAVVDRPTVEIRQPPDGFKLRQGRRTPVRVHVASGTRPLRDWSLRLIAPDGGTDELASGSTSVTDRVADLTADALEAGSRYTLELHAHDIAGAEATARASFLIPDPQYTLIPLEPGNFSRTFNAGLTIDGSGNRAVFGGASGDPGQVFILDALSGTLRDARIIASSEGQKLSADGRRFFFHGGAPPRPLRLGIEFLELDTGRFTLAVLDGDAFFSVDRTGQRVAFQSVDPDSNSVQYYFYDEATQQMRQLTSNAVIDLNGVCPRQIGTTPMISGDGDTVAFVTTATLGLVPADPPGCHVFAYEVPRATLRHVRTLPTSTRIDLPAISDDGRWLSFTVTRVTPPKGSRDYPALLDLRTGALTEPVGGITDFTNGDAVISGDASAIVISSQADLDPRVGNADHNLELFLYDRAEERFTQISETTGGIGRFPGGCPARRPSVSTEGRVVAFGFTFFSDPAGCQLDGPQRNEVDGFNLGSVRAVRRRRENRGAVFTPESDSDARVVVGNTLTIELGADDPDGDAVVFFAQELGGLDVPRGSEITDHHDGTATFRWPTKPENAGLHHVRVAAFDEGGGEVFHDVTIAVCSRIVHDGTLPGVLGALFETEPPAPCRDADVNGDGAVSAADLVRSGGRGVNGLPRSV